MILILTDVLGFGEIFLLIGLSVRIPQIFAGVMDAQAKKKALFRSKLNAKKKDSRIDSPLVRLTLLSSFLHVKQ